MCTRRVRPLINAWTLYYDTDHDPKTGLSPQPPLRPLHDLFVGLCARKPA